MALTVSGMAKEMEKAMASEWDAVYKTPLPDTGKKDREMLFRTISRGILTHLLNNQIDLVDTVTLKHGPLISVNYHAADLSMRISIDQ